MADTLPVSVPPQRIRRARRAPLRVLSDPCPEDGSVAALGPSSTGMTARPAEDAAAAGETLGGVARRVQHIPASSTAGEVDELFRADRTLRCLLVAGDEPVLVDRSWFEAELTGGLGYGRLLHAHTPVARLVREPTLVLSEDCPLLTVATTLIGERGPGAVAPSLVVTHPDGTWSVAHAADVFERLARDLAHQSVHDTLTGLPNRAHLTGHLRQGTGTTPPAVFFFVDLDRFKDVNDAHGHAAGDQVLTQFADRLRRTCRSDDAVVRLGGDEFAVLVHGDLPPPEATDLALRIVAAAAEPFTVVVHDEDHVRTTQVTIGASVGIARRDAPVGVGGADGAERPTTSLEALMRRADLAMYRAKDSGRGQVAEYDGELRAAAALSGERAREDHRLERRLRAAIDTRQIALHYQPVVELPAGRVTGVEALARWTDDELGQVPPDRFVPVAERTGLIVELGRHVLRTACAQAAAWARDGDDDLVVSVNVSPVELGRSDFLQMVRDTLREAGLPPRLLCLELTETAAVEDLDQTVATLTALRRDGVRVALDDFGTGHSSLTLLRTLPLDVVKIDRSFVAGVAATAQDAMLVRMVIDTAHALGLRVCAEGIEDRDQARQLAALGCDAAQGWHFGRPEPACDRLTRHLRRPGEPVDLREQPPVPLSGTDELVLVTTADRTITYASSTCLPLLGWTPAEMVGTNVLDHLSPHVAERVAAGESVGTLHENGSARHRAIREDGAVRWFDTTSRAILDETGSVREVISTSHDVTDTVTAAEALALSEVRFRHAFDAAPIGMAINDPGGCIVRINTALADLLGYDADELVGRTIASFTHPDDVPTDQVNLACLSRDQVQTVDKRYLDHAGRAVPVTVHVRMLDGPEGATGHAIAHVVPRAAPPAPR